MTQYNRANPVFLDGATDIERTSHFKFNIATKLSLKPYDLSELGSYNLLHIPIIHAHMNQYYSEGK